MVGGHGRRGQGRHNLDLQWFKKSMGMNTQVFIQSRRTNSIHKTPTEDYTLSRNRGNKGMRTIRVTEQNGPVVRVLEVEEDHQLFIITQLGKLIRIPVENIRIIGRVTQGNRLIRLNDNETVIAVATVIEEEEESVDQSPDDSESPESSESESQD